jgi:N-acetylneuraminic acid mutarotase
MVHDDASKACGARGGVGRSARVIAVALGAGVAAACASLGGLTGGGGDSGAPDAEVDARSRDATMHDAKHAADAATDGRTSARHDSGRDGAARDRVRPAEAGPPDTTSPRDTHDDVHERTDSGCSAATCAGCCNGDACVTATDSLRCGTGGGACEACDESHSCAAGACTGGSLVLFGGVVHQGGQELQYNDTWVFNGAAWKQIVVNGPPARNGANMATVNGRPLLFGGFNGTDNYNDTWVWNGAAWVSLGADSGPGARNVGTMATLNQTVVLFGGFDNQTLTMLGDTVTWAADGGWGRSQVLSPGPVPLAGGAAGTPGGFMVLFGGSNASNVALDDTWLWNGVRWAKASPAVSPSARDGSAAGVLGGKLVLFGGEQGYAEAVLDDTWVWDGSMSTWAQENVTGPPGRAYAASAVLNGELVVFGGRVAFQDGGGSVALGDTWTWNGSRWTELHIPGPSARYYTSMAAQVF